MAGWAATKAKAEFSAMLDKVETDGPQLVTRRKREFYVLKKEQLAQRESAGPVPRKPFVSGWDALRASFDVDFPRLHSKARWVKF